MNLRNSTSRHKGNTLVEALVQSSRNDGWFEFFRSLLELERHLKNSSFHRQSGMNARPSDCMLPLVRHTRLAKALGDMLEKGYAAPATRRPKHVAYLLQPDEGRYVGISGAGKTSVTFRILVLNRQELQRGFRK